MADSADSTPAPSGQVPLTVADLNTAVNHEPRVEDIRVAEALGMERPRNIRKLIKRHRQALERLGAICSTVEQNTETRGRGRPGRTFWLNKRQCLYLCAKSEMPRATEITIQMVEVFDAHLAALAAKPVSVEGHRRALPKRQPPGAQSPSSAAFVVERDGFSVMQIGCERVLVDLLNLATGAGTRAVVIDWDATIAIQDMTEARSHRRFLGARSFTLPDPTAKGGRRSVWAVGTVVAAQTLAFPDKVATPKARAAKAPRRPVLHPARPAMPPRPDLAGLAVCGTA